MKKHASFKTPGVEICINKEYAEFDGEAAPHLAAKCAELRKQMEDVIEDIMQKQASIVQLRLQPKSPDNSEKIKSDLRRLQKRFADLRYLENRLMHVYVEGLSLEAIGLKTGDVLESAAAVRHDRGRSKSVNDVQLPHGRSRKAHRADSAKSAEGGVSPKAAVGGGGGALADDTWAFAEAVDALTEQDVETERAAKMALLEQEVAKMRGQLYGIQHGHSGARRDESKARELKARLQAAWQELGTLQEEQYLFN